MLSLSAPSLHSRRRLLGLHSKLLFQMTKVTSRNVSHSFEDALKTLNTLQSGQKAMTAPDRLRLKPRDRMAAWIEYLGIEVNKPRYIHIAGTKGKGTTCLYTEDVLRNYLRANKSNVKIGCLTSPHVSSVRERIRVGFQPISEECFAENFWALWSRMHSPGRLAETPQLPGYPALITLLAFYTFAHENVDLAIVETGMGGETDSTNIIQTPIATGITELGFDHMKALGSTIESIAWHKAGIFKAGAPAFSVPQTLSAVGVLEERASEKGTQIKFLSDKFLTDKDIHVRPDEPFQRLNASLAIALAQAYVGGLDPPGDITAEVAKCIEHTELPGKFEILTKGKNQWVITTAHNDMSIAAASQGFASYSKNHKGSRVLLFTHDSDRDSETFLRIIFETICKRSQLPIDKVIFCSDVLSNVVGERPDLVDLRKTIDQTADIRQRHVANWRKLTDHEDVRNVPTVRDAIAQVSDQMDTTILVIGSSYVAGMVREVLLNEQQAQRVP